MAALTSPNTDERIAALEYLWYSPRVAHPYLPLIATMLVQDSDKAVRWRAAEVLRINRSNSTRSMDSLFRALGDEQYYVRLHARWALRELSEPEHTEAILAQLLRWNSNERVRLDAIRELSSLGTMAHETQRIIEHALQHDEYLDVREKAAAALGASRHEKGSVIQLLMRFLADPALPVRVAAACSLAAKDFVNEKVVSTLLSALDDPCRAAQAWSMLIRCCDLEPSLVESMIKSLHPDDLHRFKYETLARGILPTVGMKIWHKEMPIEIPSRSGPPADGSYPWIWEDLGVFHSWKGHGMSRQRTGYQVCVHGDWFPDIHLIPIVQMICFHKGAEAAIVQSPMHLEGCNIGFLAQGGGTIERLDGMREFADKRPNERIDFAHGFIKDLRTTQLLMFAGLSRYVPPSVRFSATTRAAEAWDSFVSSVRMTFARYSLRKLTGTSWYGLRGRRSVRYGYRHERPFTHIAQSLEQLASTLHHPRGSTLRDEITSLVEKTTSELETLILQSRDRLSPHVARVIVPN
ncbi:MAG: HEAT repeat domain-containing protein [Patescibacteria group bacterium]